MKVSIRVAEQLKGQLNRRGLIAEIEKHTGIERHTVSGLLNNTVKYVSIDALAKIGDYLIDVHKADPATLPGALVGRDPERLWEILACCEQLDLCVGTRTSPEWRGAEYVMSTDSRLQGVLLSKVARFEGKRENEAAPDGERQTAVQPHCYPKFHLVSAPGRNIKADNPGPEWTGTRQRSEGLYKMLGGDNPQPAAEAQGQEQGRKGSALIALGSVKVNPVVELMLAHTFRATPFAGQDQVAQPADRTAPILFSYRQGDPRPPSCCGGMQLAAGHEASEPGVYYETDEGTWECCPSILESSDAAFIFYTYRPNIAHAEVACGGFSSRATHYLTEHLDRIVSELGEPQFVSGRIHVGMYVIHFPFDPKNPDYTVQKDNRPTDPRVIPVGTEAMARRLKHWR